MHFLSHIISNLVAATAATVVFTACAPENSADSEPHTTHVSKMDTVIVDRGRSDALKADAFPENSYEREQQILKIRAGEKRLREKGFNASADAYAAGADSVLEKH